MTIWPQNSGLWRRRVERREYPRFPVRHEIIKFLVRNSEKTFQLRDLSFAGLGIELAEHGETLLFPMGQQYRARLNLAGETFPVEVEAKRVEAAHVGFAFRNLTDPLRARIEETIDPLRIALSLKAIRAPNLTDSFREGVTAWYHGEMNSDLYLWQDGVGEPLKAVLLWNGQFWEWSAAAGVRTGEASQDFDKKLDLHPDSQPLHKRVYQARKILENVTELPAGVTKVLTESQV